MTIDLDSFKIESYPLTDNWSNIKLVALDQNKKRVVVAVTSFATGALGKFPHATKEAKEKSLNNLAKYYIKKLFPNVEIKAITRQYKYAPEIKSKYLAMRRR